MRFDFAAAFQRRVLRRLTLLVTGRPQTAKAAVGGPVDPRVRRRGRTNCLGGKTLRPLRLYGNAPIHLG